MEENMDFLKDHENFVRWRIFSFTILQSFILPSCDQDGQGLSWCSKTQIHWKVKTETGQKQEKNLKQREEKEQWQNSLNQKKMLENCSVAKKMKKKISAELKNHIKENTWLKPAHVCGFFYIIHEKNC